LDGCLSPGWLCSVMFYRCGTELITMKVSAIR
jgi:hypothetical protein